MSGFYIGGGNSVTNRSARQRLPTLTTKVFTGDYITIFTREEMRPFAGTLNLPSDFWHSMERQGRK